MIRGVSTTVRIGKGCLDNHPADDVTAFLEHRCLNEEQAAMVATRHSSGIFPSHIMVILRKNSL